MNSNALTTFQNVLSNDNSLRQEAEREIEATKTLNFQEALSFFLIGINSEDTKIAQLAVLLFKKSFLDDKKYLESVITKDVADGLLNNIFYKYLDREREWKFLERIAECIARLYSATDLASHFYLIKDLFNDDHATFRKFSVFLLESVCDLGLIKEDLIRNAKDDFLKMFQKGLVDEVADVRILTLQATTTLLTNIKDNTLAMEFSALSKEILNSLIYTLQNDSNLEDPKSKAKTCLETMNTLTDLHPKIWKNTIEEFFHVISEILRTKTFPNVLRESAFQLILSLTKSTPAFVRKSSNFQKVLIPLLVEMLKEVDYPEDLKEWTTQTEEDENQKSEMFYSVREGLDLIGVDLGGKFVLDLLNPYISNLLASQNWIDQHAGFTAMGWMAETCVKQYKQDLQNLLK